MVRTEAPTEVDGFSIQGDDSRLLVGRSPRNCNEVILFVGSEDSHRRVALSIQTAYRLSEMLSYEAGELEESTDG